MDYYAGMILLLPFDFAPMDTVLCDGSMLTIADHEALYDVIKTTYGGDGVKFFRVPNMLGLEPIPEMNYYIVKWGISPE
jgi:microcystin-dependent protein